MNFKKSILLLTFLSVFLPSSNLLSQVTDIYKAKEEVRKYHKTGEYLKDIAVIANKAIKFLENRTSEEGKMGVVFDIDETLLSNYLFQDKEVDFGYVPDLWSQWVNRASATPILPVRKLMKMALKRGVSVFIITGRRENQREETEENLLKAGCKGYKKLFMKPVDYKGTAKKYKTGIRKEIQNGMGYKIIINIGDQFSDIEGGYSEKTYKLPNHIYFIP